MAQSGATDRHEVGIRLMEVSVANFLVDQWLAAADLSVTAADLLDRSYVMD